MNTEIHYRPGNSAARVDLAPGESFTAEGGAMIAMSGDMQIETTTHKKGNLKFIFIVLLSPNLREILIVIFFVLSVHIFFESVIS